MIFTKMEFKNSSNLKKNDTILVSFKEIPIDSFELIIFYLSITCFLVLFNSIYLIVIYLKKNKSKDDHMMKNEQNIAIVPIFQNTVEYQYSHREIFKNELIEINLKIKENFLNLIRNQINEVEHLRKQFLRDLEKITNETEYDNMKNAYITSINALLYKHNIQWISYFKLPLDRKIDINDIYEANMSAFKYYLMNYVFKLNIITSKNAIFKMICNTWKNLKNENTIKYEMFLILRIEEKKLNNIKVQERNKPNYY